MFVSPVDRIVAMTGRTMPLTWIDDPCERLPVAVAAHRRAPQITCDQNTHGHFADAIRHPRFTQSFSLRLAASLADRHSRNNLCPTTLH